MESKEQFKDQNYEIAKALHHVSIAKQYFEMIALSYERGAKQLMNFYANKMVWIINDVYDRLEEDTRLMYRESLIKGDTVFAEAIADKFLNLSEQQKVVVEKFVDSLLNGETVEYVSCDAEVAQIPY